VSPRGARKESYSQKAKDRSVRCPDCRAPRVVTQRTANRIASGELTGRCSECRHGYKPIGDKRLGARLNLAERRVFSTREDMDWWLAPGEVDEFGYPLDGRPKDGFSMRDIALLAQGLLPIELHDDDVFTKEAA
jgi:hypothetical protein